MIRFVKCQVIMSAIALISVLAMASCEEHTDIYDSSIKVGNILLSDNTVVSPYGYDRDSHMAVGVIFYTNEDTALVVGTKELGRHVYTDSIGTVSNVTNDAVSLCGAENTAAILSSTFRHPVLNISFPCGRSCEELSQSSLRLGAALSWRVESTFTKSGCRFRVNEGYRWRCFHQLAIPEFFAGRKQHGQREDVLL